MTMLNLLQVSSSSTTTTTTAATSTLVLGGVGAAFALATLYSRTKKVTVEDEAPLPEAPTGSRFVELPESGVTLRYTDTTTSAGDSNDESNKNQNRVTFVLLHGFAGVLETWDFLTPFLLGEGSANTKTNTKTKTHRVIALDLVGSGFSSKPNAADFDYTFRSQGRVACEFIRALGLGGSNERVVLVGHSASTVVAPAAALQCHSSGVGSVKGIVFVANALFREQPALFSYQWLRPLFRWMCTKAMGNRKKSLSRMHLPVHAEKVLTDDFVETFAAPTRLPGFYDALVATVMAQEAPYEELVEQLLALPTPVPMLFVHGADDAVYKPPPDEQKKLLDLKLDAIVDANLREQQRVETAELEECQHYAQHEQPEALAKEILGFVERNVLL